MWVYGIVLATRAYPWCVCDKKKSDLDSNSYLTDYTSSPWAGEGGGATQKFDLWNVIKGSSGSSLFVVSIGQMLMLFRGN